MITDVVTSTTTAGSGWDAAAGLAGKGILITGAASGIGRAMAMEAACAQMSLVLADLDGTGLSATNDEIVRRTPGVRTTCVEVDLTDPTAYAQIRAAQQYAGMVDPTLLFHAAGIIIRRDEVIDVTPDDWDLQVAVNQKASWFLTRAFAESLRARQSPGAIVLVSSISGYLGLISGSWVYAATKGAVTSMVKGFAKTYAADGIRVNGLCPGLVETPMVRGDVENEALDRLVREHVPIGRTADPTEVVRAGLFLLSDYATYVVGVNLDVDGGWLRR